MFPVAHTLFLCVSMVPEVPVFSPQLFNVILGDSILPHLFWFNLKIVQLPPPE